MKHCWRFPSPVSMEVLFLFTWSLSYDIQNIPHFWASKWGWNFTWMKIQFNCLSWEIIAINIPLNISLRDISIVKHDWIVVRLESIQFMPLLNGSLRKEYFVVVVVVVYRNYSVYINLNNFSFFSVSIRVRNLLTSSWGALNKSYASNLLFSLSCLRIMEKGVCCLLYWIRWVCKWKI